MFTFRTALVNFHLACFELAITAACYLTLYQLAVGGPANEHMWVTSGRASALAVVLAIWLVLLFYFGMYQSRRMDSVFADLSILAKVAAVGLIALEALTHLLPALRPTPWFLPQFVGANFLVAGSLRAGVRLLLREVRRRGYNTKRLLVVAKPELSSSLCQKLARRAYYGYEVLAPIEYAEGTPQAELLLLEEFRKGLALTPIDDVILGLPAQAQSLVAQIVAECESRGINIRLVPDLFPVIQGETQVYDLDGIPLINVHLYPTERFAYVFLKRTLDMLASLAVLILFSPVYLLTAFLIKLTSDGSVFVAQERVGLNGKKFMMLKFRTMRSGGEHDPNTHWTTPNDSHVTPLGRWLRRSNLDELPQFLNVLKGDMSLVGPRPERPFFIERFRQEIPHYMLRHYVKCGITGWAQVNGWRGDTSIRERLAHDLYYVQNWGLSLDLKILFLTVMKSFFHRNAY